MQENLTHQERLERIAQIINKGIYLLALKEGWFVNPAKKECEDLQNDKLDLEEQLIINLCKNKGMITNKEVQGLLGIHRNTATKRLKEMAAKRLLIQNGNHRHTYYTEDVHRVKNVHRIEQENHA